MLFFFIIIQIKTLVIDLPSHPTSSFIPRIVQPFAGISQQFVAVLHQGEEITVGGVCASGREGSPLVLRSIQPFAGTSKDFATIRQ